jgi:hypothetical protein
MGSRKVNFVRISTSVVGVVGEFRGEPIHMLGLSIPLEEACSKLAQPVRN